MVPRLYRQVAPGVTGQSLAGLGARANAGVGRQLEQLGREVRQYADVQTGRSDMLAASRAWRQLDDWRIKYLQDLPARRKDLAATTLDPDTGANRTGYEAELRAFPDAMNAQFESLGEGLSAQAREALERRYNESAPQWSAQAVDALNGLELEDAAIEIRDLARADRVSDAMEVYELYKDRLSPTAQARIETQIAEAGLAARIEGVQGYLQEVARVSGWQEAGKLLDDTEFQKTWELNLSEASDIKTDLDKFVHDQAAMDEAKERAALEANNDGVLADAWEGKLDLATLPDRVRSNEVDASVAAQARAIMVNPAVEDDVEVLTQAYGKLRAVKENAGLRADALKYVRDNAGKLTAGTAKELIRDVQSAGSADDPLSRVTYKTLDDLLDQHFKGETFGNPDKLPSQKKYAQAKADLARWVKQHPDAADADIRDYYGTLIQDAKPGFWKRVWQLWAGGTRFPNEWDADIHPDVVGLGQSPARHVLAEDEGREPLTVEEFYDVVKSLPADSPEQKAYYGKWRSKW